MDDYESIEKDIQKITFGGKFARVKDSFGRERLFILYAPSLQDKVFIDYIHQEALNEAKEMGLLSELELRHAYKHRNIWSEDNDESIKKLGDKLRGLKNSKPKTNREKRILELSIQATYGKLESLLHKKHDLFGQSVEKHANDARQNALVFSITYDEFGNKFWPSWSDFEKECDSKLIKNLITAYIEREEISGKRIRRLARSNVWRFQWQAAKGVGDLFEKPIIELDPEQQALVYWSQVYDSVYESMDRPDDSVIEDDDKLDKWFENQNKKRKVDRINKGKEAGGIKLSDKVARHGEVFIVAKSPMNPDAPSADEIENLNSSMAQKFKQAEAKRVKEKGSIGEKDLRKRGNHMARKMIGSKDAILGKGGIGGQARGGKGAKRVLPGGSL